MNYQAVIKEPAVKMVASIVEFNVKFPLLLGISTAGEETRRLPSAHQPTVKSL